MNYRTRLTVLTCAAISCTLVAASFVTYTLARNEAYGQVDEALEDRIILTRAFQERDAERRETQAAAGADSIPGPARAF